MQAVQSLLGWLKAPFATPLNPVDIFLVVGVIMVAIILWNMILFHIRIAAESVT